MVISITIPTKASHQNDGRLSTPSYLIAFRSISIDHETFSIQQFPFEASFSAFYTKI